MEPRQVDERIRSRGAAAECPACGSEKRSVVRPPIALVAANDPDQQMFDPYDVTTTWCAALICENCGLVRLHSVSALGLASES
jgi:hypothetical protein